MALLQRAMLFFIKPCYSITQFDKEVQSSRFISCIPVKTLQKFPAKIDKGMKLIPSFTQGERRPHQISRCSLLRKQMLGNGGGGFHHCRNFRNSLTGTKGQQRMSDSLQNRYRRFQVIPDTEKLRQTALSILQPHTRSQSRQWFSK